MDVLVGGGWIPVQTAPSMGHRINGVGDEEDSVSRNNFPRIHFPSYERKCITNERKPYKVNRTNTNNNGLHEIPFIILLP